MKKTRSELAVVKNVNSKLEKRIINLQKNQAKTEQYSRRNNIELSGIANGAPEINLEIVVEDICNDFGLEIETKDIERCHRLPISRYCSWFFLSLLPAYLG